MPGFQRDPRRDVQVGSVLRAERSSQQRLEKWENLVRLYNSGFYQLAIVTDPNASPSTAVTSLKAMYNGCMDTETIEVNLKA